MLGPLKTPSPKKSRSFPLWLEAALTVLFIVMAVLEFNNAQWFWAAIFGVAGVFFGISLALHAAAGDKHGQS